MDRRCEHCGELFEGRPNARFCSEAHRKAYARVVTSEGLTPAQEQAIRDDLGYTSSETRSKAERDAAAARMLQKTRLSPAEQEEIDRVVSRLRAQEAEHERKVAAAVAALGR